MPDTKLRPTTFTTRRSFSSNGEQFGLDGGRYALYWVSL